MENGLIYIIGEALYMEMENIKNISYPQGENPSSLSIELEDGKRYRVAVDVIE